MSTNPPWKFPAGGAADGGGVKRNRQSAMGKARETVWRKATELRRGKPRYVRRAAVIWQTTGNGGTAKLRD